MSNYDAASIQILEGLEAIRRRPAMFLGDVRGPQGPLAMLQVWIELGLALDANLPDALRRVDVVIHDDQRAEVILGGVCLPTARLPDGTRVDEAVLTRLGGFWAPARERGALCGVGAAVANALSSTLVFDNHAQRRVWRQRFAVGRAVGSVEDVGAAQDGAIHAVFELDPTIFGTSARFEAERLTARLEELAFLYPGKLWTLRDERTMHARELRCERGIADYVERFAAAGAQPIGPAFEAHEVIQHHGVVDPEGRDVGRVELRVALQAVQGTARVDSFVNGDRTRHGGSHVLGVRLALTEALAELHPRRTREHLARLADSRFTMALALTMPDPRYAGRTRDELRIEHIVPAIARRLRPSMVAWLRDHPALPAA